MLKLAAALTLVLFGAWLAGRALRTLPAAAPASHAQRLGAPLITTFVLTIVNPLTIVLFAAFSTQLPAAASAQAIGASAFALFLGSLVVQLVWAAGGSAAARFLSHVAAIRALNVASGLAIAAFGLAGVVELASTRPYFGTWSRYRAATFGSQASAPARSRGRGDGPTAAPAWPAW